MEDLTEMGVSAGLEAGGGMALVTPEPNLPEFKICNARSACQKESGKGGEKKKAPSSPAGSGDRTRLWLEDEQREWGA